MNLSIFTDCICLLVTPDAQHLAATIAPRTNTFLNSYSDKYSLQFEQIQQPRSFPQIVLFSHQPPDTEHVTAPTIASRPRRIIFPFFNDWRRSDCEQKQIYFVIWTNTTTSYNFSYFNDWSDCEHVLWRTRNLIWDLVVSSSNRWKTIIRLKAGPLFISTENKSAFFVKFLAESLI